jgi:hypothetical protein
MVSGIAAVAVTASTITARHEASCLAAVTVNAPELG